MLYDILVGQSAQDGRRHRVDFAVGLSTTLESILRSPPGFPCMHLDIHPSSNGNGLEVTSEHRLAVDIGFLTNVCSRTLVD